MEKETRTVFRVGAFKLVSAFCFWLALMFVLFPGGTDAVTASAETQLDALPASASPEEQVVPGSEKLIPLGRTTGIKMFSEGAMVVGFAQLEDAGGKSPAQQAGVQLGDVIVAVNEYEVTSNEVLQEHLANLEDSETQLTVKRNGQELRLKAEAVFDSEMQTWKIGAWVRDSIAGIGTITFVDPENGAFGALGHGISDADTGQLMDFQDGSIMESSVAGVKKGKSGEPGELTGQFDLTQNQGILYSNTDKGIFGQITRSEVYDQRKALPVASKTEIKTGSAYIISNVSGDQCKEYEIEIMKVYQEAEDTARDMMIRVVDQELLSVTGGIVQGMSGSPIIQNGKLIGAVTHVLINDPERGYGISIENMLREAVAS